MTHCVVRCWSTDSILFNLAWWSPWQQSVTRTLFQGWQQQHYKWKTHKAWHGDTPLWHIARRSWVLTWRSPNNPSAIACSSLWSLPLMNLHLRHTPHKHAVNSLLRLANTSHTCWRTGSVCPRVTSAAYGSAGQASGRSAGWHKQEGKMPKTTKVNKDGTSNIQRKIKM